MGGDKHADRVGFFLEVDDFDTSYERLRSHGVEFLTEPCDEPYGRFAVFRDISGNRWDLLSKKHHHPRSEPDRPTGATSS